MSPKWKKVYHIDDMGCLESDRHPNPNPPFLKECWVYWLSVCVCLFAPLRPPPPECLLSYSDCTKTGLAHRMSCNFTEGLCHMSESLDTVRKDSIKSHAGHFKPTRNLFISSINPCGVEPSKVIAGCPPPMIAPYQRAPSDIKTKNTIHKNVCILILIELHKGNW